MTINSKRKGASGEREVVAKYKELGFDAHRTPFSGADKRWAGDVAGVTGLHIEVKRGKAPRVWAAIDQANRDALNTIPVVHIRRDRDKGYVVVPEDFYLRLLDNFKHNL